MALHSPFSALSLGTLIRSVIVLLLVMLMLVVVVVVVVVVRRVNTRMRRKYQNVCPIVLFLILNFRICTISCSIFIQFPCTWYPLRCPSHASRLPTFLTCYCCSPPSQYSGHICPSLWPRTLFSPPCSPTHWLLCLCLSSLFSSSSGGDGDEGGGGAILLVVDSVGVLLIAVVTMWRWWW